MIRFTLNGTQIEIADGENRTLLEYLRNVKCMKGTKEACSTGHCGACSVLVDGKLTLGFTSQFISSDIEMRFFRELTSRGIDVELTSNIHDDERND